MLVDGFVIQLVYAHKGNFLSFISGQEEEEQPPGTAGSERAAGSQANSRPTSKVEGATTPGPEEGTGEQEVEVGGAGAETEEGAEKTDEEKPLGEGWCLSVLRVKT